MPASAALVAADAFSLISLFVLVAVVGKFFEFWGSSSVELNS